MLGRYSTPDGTAFPAPLGADWRRDPSRAAGAGLGRPPGRLAAHPVTSWCRRTRTADDHRRQGDRSSLAARTSRRSRSSAALPEHPTVADARSMRELTRAGKYRPRHGVASGRRGRGSGCAWRTLGRAARGVHGTMAVEFIERLARTDTGSCCGSSLANDLISASLRPGAALHRRRLKRSTRRILDFRVEPI
jgi:hypothetical protein